jgi:hypothetical protein
LAATLAGLNNHRPLSFDVTCVSVKRTSAVKDIVLRRDAWDLIVGFQGE